MRLLDEQLARDYVFTLAEVTYIDLQWCRWCDTCVKHDACQQSARATRERVLDLEALCIARYGYTVTLGLRQYHYLHTVGNG